MTPQCVEAAHYLQPYLDEYYDCLTIENLEIGTFLIEATRPPNRKGLRFVVGRGVRTNTLVLGVVHASLCDPSWNRRVADESGGGQGRDQ